MQSSSTLGGGRPGEDEQLSAVARIYLPLFLPSLSLSLEPGALSLAAGLSPKSALARPRIVKETRRTGGRSHVRRRLAADHEFYVAALEVHSRQLAARGIPRTAGASWRPVCCFDIVRLHTQFASFRRKRERERELPLAAAIESDISLARATGELEFCEF